MPTHILVECPEYVVSASLGVVECLKPIEEIGACIVRFAESARIRAKDILWADILVTVRGAEPLTVNIVREAKKAGRLIVYYLDDDLLHVPEESLARAYYQDPIIREGMQTLLTDADVLWGVNPNIRKLYLPLTRQARWIENRVPKEPAELQALSENEKPVKILYAGSTDHSVMVKELLTPVIRRLCMEYGERIDVTFIGVDPCLDDMTNVHYIPFIKPYEVYQDYVNKSGFAIGLAPGRTTQFYACKYYNKFLEYTTIGAVGVYTRAEPYTLVVEDGVNGVLCDNSEDGWYSAIRSLLDDPELLWRCAASARELLRERYNRETVTEDLLRQCPEFQTFHAPDYQGKIRICRFPFLRFYRSRAELLWRQKGVSCIPEMLWRTFKILSISALRGIKSLVQNLFKRNN